MIYNTKKIFKEFITGFLMILLYILIFIVIPYLYSKELFYAMGG